MPIFALTIFLSAFLLFQVQPLAGKYILPWFGGTPAVWTTCMLSFQVLLLVGYAYAHGLATWLSPRKQGVIHLALLIGSLLFLPIIPAETWKPEGNELPTWRILCLLVATIGPPYLLLSTTGPLLQSWFARAYPGRSPYRLYSLSNVGSLAALVSYPFVFEPMMRLGTQAWGWSFGYGAFALLCGGLAVYVFWTRPGDAESLSPGKRADSAPPADAPRPTVGDGVFWVLLSGCGSVLLLATTNQMCQEVAVVPFLWILPLALYLLTFILCFDHERWYQRAVFGPLLIASVIGACVVMGMGIFVPLWAQVVVYSGSMFICCMVCHGELVRHKPHPRYLTRFYLLISTGGALGGMFVSLAAPWLFRSYLEYPIGLTVCCMLFLAGMYLDPACGLREKSTRRLWAICAVGGILWFGALGVYSYCDSVASLKRVRNFYGLLQVSEGDDNDAQCEAISLHHGRILHGFQLQEPEKRDWPTSYYGPDSGAGLAVRFHPRRGTDKNHPKPLRIGVIGLGVGTMAAHGRPGDVIRFYEINPAVIALSKKPGATASDNEGCFTYMADSKAAVDVVLGDARISLERALKEGRPEEFDVLVVDAFSSDSIPVHLLTRECCQIYWDHLKPDGILAIHISNRFLDLAPVVRGLAKEFNREAALIESAQNKPRGVDSATWVLLTNNRSFLDGSPISTIREPWPENARRPILWTDDFSNLFEVLK